MSRYYACKIMEKTMKLTHQLFFDRSNCEVFVYDGYYTMTGNIFIDEAHKNVTFFSSGKTIFSNVVYHNIQVE